MASVFIAGLTRGNGQLERETREGTLVAVFDHAGWLANNKDDAANLAIGVSDENGEFLRDIGDIPQGAKLRIHIRELGFRYLGFDIPTDDYGVNYPVRLEVDPAISDDFLKGRYPNSERASWDSEAEFQKALAKVMKRREALLDE